MPRRQVSIVPYPGGYWPLVNVLIARVVAPTIIVILMYSLAFRFRRRNREQKQCAKVRAAAEDRRMRVGGSQDKRWGGAELETMSGSGLC